MGPGFLETQEGRGHEVSDAHICDLLSPTTAQQEAQRAQFLVEKAKQEQRQKIVQAEGEAEAAKMISFCWRDLGSPLGPMAFPSSLLGWLMRLRRMRFRAVWGWWRCHRGSEILVGYLSLAPRCKADQ